MEAEEIEILSTGIESIAPGDRWPVLVGSEAARFVSNLRADQRENVLNEAIAILARCTAPTEVSRRAGLIVGHVQSGKTTSFTCASALAADNGYGLVVIIGGTSNPLLNQTRERLSRDLNLGALDAFRRWIHIPSPRPGSNEAARLSAAIRDQLDPIDEMDRVPVLVTIMKQHKHMDDFARVLEDLHDVDLSNVATLIVDDEADQATPNLKRNGSESTTYSRLRRIRAALPAHTLLQYTATPQAPLLVSIADEISPDFVCTLLPGSEYTGGKHFFVDEHDNFVRHIPHTDLDFIDGLSDGPPPSLIEAFAVFAMGCAIAQVKGEFQPPQRSMLVHPSQRTLPQSQFTSWLRAIRDHAVVTLSLPRDDPDLVDHVERLWRPAWNDLSTTVDPVQSLEALLPRCARVLSKIIFEEVNATVGASPQVQWSTGPYWVLVGGQLLDRGFTVEGLTVTYMPRGVGVGNADTIQQRGRFFGYKREYAKYCRAYLDPTVDGAFTNYVQHEEFLRQQLAEVADSGKSLKDWKRVFFLDGSLRPTRQSVIRLDLATLDVKDGWFGQRDFSDPSEDLIRDNRVATGGFVDGLQFRPFDEVNGPELAQQHMIARTDVDSVLRGLLTGFVMWGDDTPAFTALRVMLEEAGTAEDCDVVLISPHMVSPPRRRRSLGENGKIKNLFQGQNPKSGRLLYVGDRRVRREGTLTVQIHRLDLHAYDGTDEGGGLVATDVPVLALYVPEGLRSRVVIQR